MNKIKNIERKIEGSENKLKHNIEINRMQNSLCNYKIVKYLKHIKSELDDTQQKVMEKIMEINMLLQNSKKELISTSTSMLDLSQVKSIISIDGWEENINKEENINEVENIKEFEDNELLNECYDSIPLNNLKKNTSGWFI
jgi:F0F1-type ATP synthase alpha subunit